MDLPDLLLHELFTALQVEWVPVNFSSMIEAHPYPGDVKGSVVRRPTRMFGTPKAKNHETA